MKPAPWRTVGLHDICRPKQWKTITSSELTPDGYLVYGANGPIGRYHAFNHLDPTILIGCRGSCGKVTVSEPKSWITGNAMALDDLDTSIIDLSYLVHALKSDGLASAVTGTSQPQITQESLRRIAIPLPPLEEQRRIASILDAADALRSKRRQALEKLDSLTQSIFIDMFGNPRSSDGRYVRRSVGDLARNEDAKRVPVKMSDRAQVQGAYPYYGASGVIDYVDDYLFDGQRLLVAEDGANLLARSSPVAFLADGKYWVNNHAHVLADNGAANLTFLRQAIESLDLGPFITGSAQPKLTRKMLDSITVPAPPRSAQDEFESRVLHLRQVETASMKGLARLDALFASLQHRAFRGEL